VIGDSVLEARITSDDMGRIVSARWLVKSNNVENDKGHCLKVSEFC
jgi:hypothetical protein